jgi:hypothetical protein
MYDVRCPPCLSEMMLGQFFNVFPNNLTINRFDNIWSHFNYYNCRDTELLKWVYELQRQVHNPPTYNNEQHPGKMECIITCGAQHGLSLVSFCVVIVICTSV